MMRYTLIVSIVDNDLIMLDVKYNMVYKYNSIWILVEYINSIMIELIEYNRI